MDYAHDLDLARDAWGRRHADGEASVKQSREVRTRAITPGQRQAWAWATLTALWHGEVPLASADDDLGRCIGLFTILDDARGLAVAHTLLARLALRDAEAERAYGLLLRAEPVLQNGPREDWFDWLKLASVCAGQRRQTEAAIQYLATALEVLPPNDLRQQAQLVNNLANMCADLGDYETACSAFTLAKEMAERSSPDDLVFMHVGAIQAFTLSGDVAGAMRLARPFLPRLDTLYAREPHLALTLGVTIAWALAKGGDARAHSCLDAALAAGRAPPPGVDDWIDSVRAQVALLRGDLASSRALAAGVVRLARAAGHPLETRVGLELLIDAARRANDHGGIPGLAAELADVPRKSSLVGRALVNQLRQVLDATIHSELLSEAERTCLAFAANGQTSHDIAIKLGVARRTVDQHFSNIARKLKVLNRQEAIAKFARTHRLH